MAVILAHLFLTIVYTDNSNIPTTFVKTNIEKCDEKAKSVSKDLLEAIQVLELKKNQDIYSTNLCLVKILQKLFALQYELTATGSTSQKKKYRYTFSKPAPKSKFDPSEPWPKEYQEKILDEFFEILTVHSNKHGECKCLSML